MHPVSDDHCPDKASVQRKNLSIFGFFYYHFSHLILHFDLTDRPVADPDLELRGAVLIDLPCWLFFLLSFFLFLPKIPPWAPPLDPPLVTFRVLQHASSELTVIQMQKNCTFFSPVIIFEAKTAPPCCNRMLFPSRLVI